MGLFDLFGGKKKPESAMDVFIHAVYGNPPPPKRAKLSEAVELANELLMGEVSEQEKEKKVAPMIVKSFEDTLYKLYKPGI